MPSVRSREPSTPTTEPFDAVTRIDRAWTREPSRAATSTALAAFTHGTTLGRYLVLEELGVGGMGRVVKAYDSRLHREVALKLVMLTAEHDEDSARVMREAQAMACLSHPNVVPVFDVEQHSPQLLYLAMEYVPGATLRQWLGVRKRKLGEILAVFVQAGRGLAAAHAAGIVHRDVKPSNVMVGSDGRARVTDFGLARGTDGWVPSNENIHASMTADITQVGLVLGTPAYMPPEQQMGEAVGPRGDQYAFCVALFEALCGHRPFTSEDPRALLEQKLSGPPPFPSGTSVPGWLQRVVQRGMAPLPEQRWPTMEALLDELGADPGAARQRWLARAVLGLAVVGAAAVWWQRPTPCPSAEEQLVGVWDEPVRDRLREAVLATGLGYAEDTWSRIDAGMQAYAEGWLHAQHDACTATLVRGEQSSETMDRRMLCLERARSALGITARALSVTDPEVVERSVQAVRELPELDHCADLERLAELAPPADPELAQRVEHGYTRLQELAVLETTGQFRRGEQEIEPLVTALEELGYLPLTAAAYGLRSTFFDQMGRYDEALDSSQQAFALALESRADHLAIDVTLQLQWVLGRRLGRLEEALSWNATGAALARRVGEPEARSKAARAYQMVLLGHFEAAEPLYIAAIDELEAARGTSDTSVANAINGLGNLYVEQARFEAALETFRKSYASWMSTLGPAHPHTAGTLLNIGITLASLGRMEEAERDIREAISLWIAAYGPRHHNVALGELELGRLLLQAGRLDEAHEAATRSLELRRDGLGSSQAETAESMAVLAEVALAREQWETAEALAREALTSCEATLPRDHPHLVPVMLVLGTAVEHRGHREEARSLYERAAEIARVSLSPEHTVRQQAEAAVRRTR